jgi:hypothetical protein
MQRWLIIMALFVLSITPIACKKNQTADTSCFPDTITTRVINNKMATIKVTGTLNPVYLVEDGAIDDRLVPCNLPMEFYENNLRVIITGEVKATVQPPMVPCCTNNFVITKITR